MTEGIEYKISLDTSSLRKGTESIRSVNAATAAFSSLLRGDFVRAAMQGREAWLLLRGAMLANPVIALAAALGSVIAMLGAIAVRRQIGEMRDLAEATKQYREELARLRGENANPTERASRLANRFAKEGDDAALEKGQRKAEARAVVADAAAARMEQMAAEAAGVKKLTEKPRYEMEAARLRLEAEQLREAAEIYAQARDDLAKGRAEEAQKTNALGSQLADAARNTDLERRMAGKSADEKLRIRLADAQARQRAAGAEYANATSDQERFKVGIKAEGIAQEIIALKEALTELRSKPIAVGADKDQLAQVRQREKEYEFSKLTPRRQIAEINERMREIIGKKGWEQNANARAEMLDLRKRRDEASEKLKESQQESKKKPVRETSSRELSIDEVIDLEAARSRARRDNVIRMRGSRAGGFIDEDGVQRMRGSLAGGFASRLRPSAFARSAEELEAKRLGLTGREIVTSGDEQPVEIKGEALGLWRKMADALSKDS